MLTIRAMSDGQGYSARHLEHRDYYAEGERVVGQWQGRGAELLGITGDVRHEDFEALREGRDPFTGEFLRQRKGADRIAADGTTQSRARSLYDFTISAPKSVSIMAIVGGDKRLIDAHEKAVREALQELEVYAAARVRQDRANADRITGNLVLAVYHHDTSRELDPQLHAHAVAANLTYDGTEGRWKALQASGIYERRAYLTEIYRNVLARELRMLGYEIDSRRDAKGRDSGFEIRGISADLLKKYSVRSQQRDAEIQAFVQRNGRQPTDNEVAVLIRESRADKLIEISTAEVRKRQRERLTEAEARALETVRVEMHAAESPAVSAGPSLKHAKQHIFERVSVARDHDILAEALRHGRGEIRSDELKGMLGVEETTGRILRDGNQIATHESLRREREMVHMVNRDVGRFDRLGGLTQFTSADRLMAEQKRVVAFVLDSRDRAVNVSGAAGTGKTATLQELKRALREAGHELTAVAPTMSAVEELQKVGFERAMTVERLLQDDGSRGGLHNGVLILDEAGMVSSRQMWELLRLAERYSSRVVFSGDTNQIQSVEAGDALHVLEKESRLKSVALTEVRRQKPKRYREAIEELRRNPESGFEKLEELKCVQEVSWPARSAAIAKAYADFRAEGRETLVVCATHNEIERVTEAIRCDRKRAGELAESVQTARDVSLNWTAAQKADIRNFRPGQILGFHRAVQGVGKNETVEVLVVEENRLVVRNARGKTTTVTAKHAKAFDVFERRAIEIAPGDKLLLTANRRDDGLRITNGEIVTVTSVDVKGRIHLEDGRVLPSTFKQFAHGYAVTAHRSQGKSVDSVIISGEGMQKELFYVAASRGKQRIHVVTSDRESLRESVGRSTVRKSASELARKSAAVLYQGMRRGRTLARKLLSLAAQRESLRDTPAVSKQFKKAGKVERNHAHSISR